VCDRGGNRERRREREKKEDKGVRRWGGKVRGMRRVNKKDGKGKEGKD
jgi:hypothetical protein